MGLKQKYGIQYDGIAERIMVTGYCLGNLAARSHWTGWIIDHLPSGMNLSVDGVGTFSSRDDALSAICELQSVCDFSSNIKSEYRSKRDLFHEILEKNGGRFDFKASPTHSLKEE